MNIWGRIKAALRLNEAVRRADKAHKITGQRYYVMPNGKDSGKLIIMDRYNFRKLKQKNYISRDAFVYNMEKECFYCTPYGNGDGVLTKEAVDVKRKNYMSWIIACREEKLKMKKKYNAKQVR